MFDEDPNDQANISGADLAILVDELKAANQRELELLAVIERMRGYILGRGHDKDCEWHKGNIKDGATYCDCGMTDSWVVEPSQALREYEAKIESDVLNEAAMIMEAEGYYRVVGNRLRRMAEERRKK